jgi:hypothetical protein
VVSRTAIVRSDAMEYATAQLNHEQQEGNDFDDFACHNGLKLIKTLRLDYSMEVFFIFSWPFGKLRMP